MTQSDEPGAADESSEPALRKILASVADKMLADFNASGVAKHRGSKGTVREAQLLGNYLRKYLPRNVLAVHSGEVIATNGERSGQGDILILDPSTPPLWDEEDYRIVPVECLYGVIEVKSFLDSDGLRSAWTTIAEVKRLPKSAYDLPAPLPFWRKVYGKCWDYVPTAGMVFAYDGLNLDTLGAVFAEMAAKYEPEHRLDSAWVFNKGFINWTNPIDESVYVSAEPGAAITAVEASADRILMPLTAHLHEHFATAFMPRFRITDYMTGAEWGTRLRKWSRSDGSD